MDYKDKLKEWVEIAKQCDLEDTTNVLPIMFYRLKEALEGLISFTQKAIEGEEIPYPCVNCGDGRCDKSKCDKYDYIQEYKERYVLPIVTGLKAEVEKLNIILFHHENGLSHPDFKTELWIVNCLAESEAKSKRIEELQRIDGVKIMQILRENPDKTWLELRDQLEQKLNQK